MRIRPTTAFPILFSLLIAGCGEGHVDVYRTAKEKDAELPPADAAPPNDAVHNGAGLGMAGMPGMAAGAGDAAAGPDLAWTVPADWNPKALGPMQKAAYAIKTDGGDVEFSVVSLGGTGGGESPNLNRWRSQVQLPPMEEADLAGAVTRITENGVNFAVADFGGGTSRIIGAIAPSAGSTWFFKLRGPQAAVEKLKPAFLDFLKTVKPSDQK